MRFLRVRKSALLIAAVTVFNPLAANSGLLSSLSAAQDVTDSTYYVNDLVLTSEIQNRIQNKSIIQKSEVALISSAQDDDADNTSESLAFKPVITGFTPPTGGGFIPDTSYSPKNDAYNMPLGYCVWDNGSDNTSLNRINGTLVPSNVLISFSVVSSGPDRGFDTTCAELLAGTTNGDDVSTTVTLAEVNNGIGSSPYIGKPVVDLTALNALDTSNTEEGEIRTVLSENGTYAWIGGSWEQIGGGFKLENNGSYDYLNSELSVAINTGTTPVGKLTIGHDATIAGSSANLNEAAIVVTNSTNTQYLAIDANEVQQFGEALNLRGENGFRFYTGDIADANEVLAGEIDASGNWGLNVTNPTEKLHLGGNLKLEDGNKIILGTDSFLLGSGNSLEQKAYSDISILADLDASNVIEKLSMGAGLNVLQIQSGAGAQTDAITYNGNKLYHAGNMGSGSLLDADFLDGLDSTSFLKNNDTSTGNYSTDGRLIAGRGGRGVGLTINDGYGNANVTFNHVAGIAEANGNAGRITVNTDSLLTPTMAFQLGEGLTGGVATGLSTIMTLKSDSAVFKQDIIGEADLHLPINKVINLGNASIFTGVDGNTVHVKKGNALASGFLVYDELDNLSFEVTTANNVKVVNNLGVGVHTPSEKLEVAGNALANSFNVRTLNPDVTSKYSWRGMEFGRTGISAANGMYFGSTLDANQFSMGLHWNPDANTATNFYFGKGAAPWVDNFFRVNGSGEAYLGNGVGNASNKVWHQGNDGAGSGLDADTLDGVSWGNINTSVSTEIGPNKWGFRANTTGMPNWSGIWFTGDTGELILRDSSGAIKTHIMAREGSFINGHTVWTAGNQGSDSGLDADLLDGLQGQRYARSYQIPNSGAANGYIKLGTFTNYLDSGSANIKLVTGEGFNSHEAQNTMADIQLRGSWSGEPITHFLTGSMYLYGDTNGAQELILVETVKGTSDVWIKVNTHTGAKSFYTITHSDTTTWTPASTFSTTAPTGNVKTIARKEVYSTGNDSNLYVMNRGDFEGGDFNNILTPGTYRIGNMVNNNMLNRPKNPDGTEVYQWGMLKVEEFKETTNNYYLQTYVSHKQGYVLHRIRWNDVWEPWTKTYNNLQSMVATNADKLDNLDSTQFLRSDVTTTFNSVGNNFEIEHDASARIGMLWKRQDATRTWEQWITASEDLLFLAKTGRNFVVEVGANDFIKISDDQVSAAGVADFLNPGVSIDIARPSDGAVAHRIYSYTSTGDGITTGLDNLAISARGDLVFTTGDGPLTAPERMRIKQNGGVNFYNENTVGLNSGNVANAAMMVQGQGLYAAQQLVFDSNEINQFGEYLNILGEMGLRFKVGDLADATHIEAGMVDANGFWGIGSSSPQSRLHLSSGVADTGDTVLTIEADSDNLTESDNPMIKFLQDGGLIESHIALNSDAGTNYLGSISNALYFNATTNDSAFGAIQFVTGEDNDLAGIEGAARMTILSTGEIGIGTTTPTEALDVYGGARFEGGEFDVYPHHNNASTFIDLNNTAAAPISSQWRIMTGDFVDGAIDSFQIRQHFKAGGAAERLTIRNDGNIGIGTSAPSEELTVSKNQDDSTRIFLTNENNTGVNGNAIFTAYAGDNGLDIGINNDVYANEIWTPGTAAIRTWTGGPASRLWIGTGSPAPLEFYVNDNPRGGFARASSAMDVKDSGFYLNYYTSNDAINVKKSNILGFNYAQNNDANVYYHYVGRVNHNDGTMRIEGQMGGHDSLLHGKSTVDVLINARNKPFMIGQINGHRTLESPDIQVYEDPATGNLDVYLVSRQWSQLNLNLSVDARDNGNSYLSPDTPTTTVPSGTKVASLYNNGLSPMTGAFAGYYPMGSVFAKNPLNNTSYADFFTIQGSGIATEALNRKVGLRLQASNNKTTGESTKAADIYIESNQSWFNAPWLAFDVQNQRIMALNSAEVEFKKQIKFNSVNNYGSDYAVIRYDSDNNTYAKWGDTTENSALVLSVNNDGQTAASDVIALESYAGIFLNAPVIYQGTGSEVWHNSNVTTSTAMKKFSVPITFQDDYISSPISIREKGLVGGAQSTGNYAPNINFHWSGRVSNSLWMDSSGHLHYGGYDAAGNPTNNNTIYAGAFSATSDRRLKKGIKDIDGALDKVLKLRGANYYWNNGNADKAMQYGFIAQELQEVMPDAVSSSGDGYLAVKYDAVTPVLVEAMKELNDKVETVEDEVDQLKVRMDNVEQNQESLDQVLVSTLSQEGALSDQGYAKTVNGQVSIELSETFLSVVSEDSIVISVTPISDGVNKTSSLSVTKVSNGMFNVLSEGRNLNQGFYWEAKGSQKVAVNSYLKDSVSMENFYQ